MKAVPMIFNTEMVNALLDGRKTVTRRPTKKEVTYSESGGFCCDGWMYGLGSTDQKTMTNFTSSKQAPCKAGDLIWVRETFCPDPDCDHDSWDNHELSYYEWDGCGCSAQFLPDALKNNKYCLYRAGSELDCRWVPSIHMPRWASRLTLKVTDVRIERVQNITESQARSEGVSMDCTPFYVSGFIDIWESIYGNWDQNPYVWVIEFEVIHKNVDVYLQSQEALCQSE
jgi:hypothetical protein